MQTFKKPYIKNRMQFGSSEEKKEDKRQSGKHIP